MLTFPREPIVEMYLNGWRDITTDVRQSPPLTITRGRKDESAKPSPSRCTFTLNDASGDYSPRNPAGQWFGTIGRNTPVRVGLRAGSDDFARTVASGWGTSPTFGAWTDFQSATSTSSVSGGEGRHSVTSTNAYHASYLDDVNIKNVDMRVDVTIDSVSNVTGGDLEPANILLRGQNTTTYYMLRVTITTFGSIELRIMAGDAQTLAGPWTIPTLSYNGSTLRVRFQADSNTFRGKVWNAAGAEPVSWDLTYSHGDVFGAGWIGVRSGVGGGNTNTKPIVFRYDNLVVTIPRFAGETAKMLPLSEVDHTNRRVQVECSGILRRLSQGANPLLSSPRRFITSPNVPFTPTDYWPLEEMPDEVPLGANIAGGVPAIFTRETGVTPPTGAIKWNAAGGLPATAGAPEITNGAMLTLPVRNTAITSSWSALWWQRISADTGADVRLRSTLPENDVSLIFYTDGTYEVYRTTTDPLNSALLFSGSFPTFGFDDVWHLVLFGCVDEPGTTVRYYIQLDDNNQLVGVPQTTSFTPLRAVELHVDTGTTKPAAFCHVVTFPEEPIDVFPFLYPDMVGHIGEEAGTRFNRLLDEEQVPRAMVGYPTLTKRMGPQTPKPLLTLLQECVDADHGTLYEPRGDAALAMRTTRSLISKPAVLELDYAAGEVAPDFGPTDDDTDTRNDVTTKRPGGGEYRHEQVTGPMNTADPGTNPDAVGRYDSSATVNVEDDGQLIDAASWLVHLGTIDEPRFPTITVDLRAEAVASQPALVTALLDLDIDDAVTVANTSAARIYDPVRQIVRGYIETFDTAYRHTLRFNCTPASAYDGGALNGATARLGSNASTLTAGASSSATSLLVATTGAVWTGANTPFDIRVGGERMTVTAVTGATNPQTFTVTRAVNGVTKAHPTGAAVALASPTYLVP